MKNKLTIAILAISLLSANADASEATTGQKRKARAPKEFNVKRLSSEQQTYYNSLGECQEAYRKGFEARREMRGRHHHHGRRYQGYRQKAGVVKTGEAKVEETSEGETSPERE